MVIYKAVIFDMGGVLMSYAKMPYVPELREEIQKGMTSPYVLSIFNNMVEDANFAIAVPNIRNAGFRTAILTNNAFQNERRQRSIRLENAIKVHDAVIESCRIGYRKPEKEIYLIAASQLNVEPEECIFIDDLEENCKGAQEVGMTAIQVCSHSISCSIITAVVVLRSCFNQPTNVLRLK
ncbi:unnamed protein product [Toxocara canis]|uniref:HAD family phosphatase n=1 Tax=Toxocara canis TaxID=6265 RepID=A0A183VBE9_TOXCA|nr:unnamed protein product [Toxocara canis]